MSETNRRELIRIADDMNGTSNEETRQFISRIVSDLTNLKPSIAFVGQIKAGKSRLINGFTGQAEYLPSDVNPWTTVITDMHFGHPSGRTSGAEFHFFDNRQWQALIAEGEELRNMFPDDEDSYKREMIEEQVEAMKTRAKLRLGESYKHLLGQHHDLDELNTDDLARYVCAGDDPTEEGEYDPGSDRGLYSDITRKAEVYFDIGHFPYPLTVTDTPGVNDPLLIREEISRQYLKESDFFVVVLSAHQALSRADLKLFRLMQALELGQIVVFINRVDELGGGAEDAGKVHADVMDGLEKALGNSDIDVLMGSAQWAHYALTGDETGIDHDEVLAWLRAHPEQMKQYLDGVEEIKRGSGPISREGVLRFAAMIASGLPDLRRHVTSALTEGPRNEQLRMAWQHLNSFAQGELERSKAHLRAIEEESIPALESGDENSKTLADLRMLVTQKTSEIVNDMDDVLANLRGVMDDTVAEAVSAVVRGPNGDSPLLAKGGDTELNFSPLRDRMRELVQGATQVVRQRMLSELYSIDMQSNAALRALPGWQDPSDNRMNTSAVRWFRPDTTALTRGITVELRVSWLSRLISRKSVVARAERMIVQEFEIIGDDLVDTARSDLMERLNTVLDHYLALLAGHLENRMGSGETNERAEAQTALDQAQRIAAELSAIFGADDVDKLLAEAAE
ncbi:[FeFe] hydrogenase H-cluster maturation GTPase HydF [Ruegeria denitrificans]|uniref:[FeFe] hydrogenase H-cluster maturation GTPase HydF n=1 Tax=Ruegeria denitrificans TaxID=1715692 RepID=A0A0P1IGJ1_9RHOB|nr:dynamin family protein [Ruegeria denitrificans]CUJ99434.1 [FeFe] hydrogenase H-cluster maturation GTPase HydF [Ruegeria denitrificans]